jgi:hypothetical protein
MVSYEPKRGAINECGYKSHIYCELDSRIIIKEFFLCFAFQSLNHQKNSKSLIGNWKVVLLLLNQFEIERSQTVYAFK